MIQKVVSSRVAIAVVAIIFFTWGALTSLNDVLVPHLKSVFQMDFTQAILVQFVFFGTYFLMSLPSGAIVARIGYKRSIIVGLLVAAIGALAFYPAAMVPSFPLFLLALFVLATGITLLQVSANPYIALLGKPETASSRLNLAQALNSLGTTLAPAIVGPLILGSGAAVIAADVLRAMPEAAQQQYRMTEAHTVQGPYLMIALGLALLAVFIWVFRLPTLREEADTTEVHAHGFLDVLRIRHLRLGVIGIFVYVGAEVAIGSFLINYLGEARIGGLDAGTAAKYVSFYWGGAMVGRFIGSALMQRMSAARLLGMAACVAIVLLAITVSTQGHVAMYSVIAIGLFNSIMFPTIFTLAIAGLGPMTSKGSSLLIMAIVGGALVPLLQGVLADAFGLQPSFLLPIVCYAFIAWYGFRGATPRPGELPAA